VILVDPGHGGYDTGAEGILNGVPVFEKDLALRFALDLKSYLETYANATVILTRSEDIYVSLQDRWQMGRDNNVDGVVSIHWNSSTDPTISGIETLYGAARGQTPYLDREFAESVHTGILAHLPFLVNRGVRDDTMEILSQPAGTTYMYPRCVVMVEYLSNPEAMEALDLPLAEASLDVATGAMKGMRDFYDETTPKYREVGRKNCEGGTAVFNYAVCTPEHVDILWSDTAKVLSQLMSGYSGDWERAGNSNYFNRNNGTPFGYVLKHHAMLNEGVGDGERYDGMWISDPPHAVSFVDPMTDFINYLELQDCWLGINVGPLLVQDGNATDLPTQLAQAYDSSVQADRATYSENGSPILRAGIGWAPSYNRLIHVLCRSGGCSLYDLQAFFLEFPGIFAAIAFDGGGSVGVFDEEAGSEVMGHNTRIMKTAFVMTAKDLVPLDYPIE